MGKLILFVVDDSTEDGKQRVCDSLIMCILTSLNHGLRNGGGIGDLLRKPDSKVSTSGVQSEQSKSFCTTTLGVSS